MQADPVVLDGDALAVPGSANKPVLQQAPLHSKHMKALVPVPRLDYEPIYTELKTAVGSDWASYKEAVTLFLLGYLNQREFSSRVDHILLGNSKTTRLHNHFICAIISNLTRELPDHGVASWVSANDKPSAISKPVTGDATERRLKTEVMQLQPKDRRRLKAVPKSTQVDRKLSQTSVDEFHKTLQTRIPDEIAGGTAKLNQKNWEYEVRKRYDQPLASEIREFPDAETIKKRMVPICYEESILDGPTPSCATYMAIATENFIKDFLSAVFTRTRLNGPHKNVSGAMTRKYRLQLEREETAYTKGKLAKHPSGLFPIEASEASTRKGLGVRDLKLALELGGGILGHMPLVANEVMNGYVKEELEAEREDYVQTTEKGNQSHGGRGPTDEGNAEADEMDWEHTGSDEKAQLNNLLDECLSMAF
ncbi:transcriptional coactivator hfi1/ADA1 [Ascosphaera aggregata]|nr:transcriptional coactivator hfi1/ADA1 [Ascosphaera aggregata]